MFEAEGFGQTYAEMDKGIKNTISHRWAAGGGVQGTIVMRAGFAGQCWHACMQHVQRTGATGSLPGLSIDAHTQPAGSSCGVTGVLRYRSLDKLREYLVSNA